MIHFHEYNPIRSHEFTPEIFGKRSNQLGFRPPKFAGKRIPHTLSNTRFYVFEPEGDKHFLHLFCGHEVDHEYVIHPNQEHDFVRFMFQGIEAGYLAAMKDIENKPVFNLFPAKQ